MSPTSYLTAPPRNVISINLSCPLASRHQKKGEPVGRPRTPAERNSAAGGAELPSGKASVPTSPPSAKTGGGGRQSPRGEQAWLQLHTETIAAGAWDIGYLLAVRDQFVEPVTAVRADQIVDRHQHSSEERAGGSTAWDVPLIRVVGVSCRVCRSPAGCGTAQVGTPSLGKITNCSNR